MATFNMDCFSITNSIANQINLTSVLGNTSGRELHDTTEIAL